MELYEEHIGRDCTILVLRTTIQVMQSDVQVAKDKTRMLSRDIAREEEKLFGPLGNTSQRSARFLDTLNLARTQAISRVRSDTEPLWAEILGYVEPRNSMSLSSMQVCVSLALRMCV